MRPPVLGNVPMPPRRAAAAPGPSEARFEPASPPPPHVLSFDVGIANLAYASVIAEPTAGPATPRLRAWGVIDLGCKTASEACGRLVAALDARAGIADGATHVLIESQTVACKKIHAVAHAIQTYFVCRGWPPERVVFVHPAHKLRVYKGEPVEVLAFTHYHENKQTAIEHCRRLVGGGGDQPEALAFFEGLPKQDDCADAYLQAAWFLGDQRARAEKEARKAARAARRGTKRPAEPDAPPARPTDAGDCLAEGSSGGR